MQIVYSVAGKVYRYEVYKPETGSKYYVRKLSKGGTKVGKDQGFSSETAAKSEANRRANSEGLI